MKTQALGNLRKENKQTRKPEHQLVWACFLLGLWGQEETRTSLKSFSTTDVAATTEKKAVGWVCCKYNSRWSGGLWVWADTSPYKSRARVCRPVHGSTPPPPGNQKPEEGPRERKHLYTESGGWTPKTSRLPGRAEKGRNTLQQNPPDLTKGNSLFRLQVLLDSQISKLSATATTGNRATLKHSEEWDPTMRRFRNRNGLSDPLLDGPVGTCTCGAWG